MKLSDLIHYKNIVDSLTSEVIKTQAVSELDAVVFPTQHPDSHYDQHRHELKKIVHNIEQQFDNFENQLNRLQTKLLESIQVIEQSYLAGSESLLLAYNADSPEHILNRRRPMDEITRLYLKTRLINHTNWQWPALIFRPAHAQWIDDLVACDPMYFADTHLDLLTATKHWFTPEYQRRLRHYVIQEDQSPMLEQLPQSQFGLVYACHYFEYKTIGLIEKYLTEIYSLLRPGGVCLFTYNNCDFANAVKIYEHYSACYTPKRLMLAAIKKIGYEILDAFDDSGATSWMEIKKPGQRTSIRGGQTLATVWNLPSEDVPPKIDPPVDPLPVDNDDVNIYNEVDMLLDISRFLNLDLNMAKSKGAYSVKKLRRMIAQAMHSDNFPTEKIERLISKRKQQ
jgi:hypothetical protein